MDNDIKPSTLLLIGGGIALFVSTFLDWTDDASVNGWSTENFGTMGIILAAISLGLTISVISTTFGELTAPESILGFSQDQLNLVLGLISFFMLFPVEFIDNTGTGILIGWLAAVAIIAGAWIDLNEESQQSPPIEF